MLDGRLTLNAAIDASGHAACSIPTEDIGLIQDVEDCMSARLMRESFGPSTPWMATVPVVVRGGAVAFGERARVTLGLDSVETYRMPNAFGALESLTPTLEECVHELVETTSPYSLVVGARIAIDGTTQCALAIPESGTLPANVSGCATHAFLETKFPPPKGGPGLIRVPITVERR
jgi:hypothetical protein